MLAPSVQLKDSSAMTKRPDHAGDAKCQPDGFVDMFAFRILVEPPRKFGSDWIHKLKVCVAQTAAATPGLYIPAGGGSKRSRQVLCVYTHSVHTHTVYNRASAEVYRSTFTSDSNMLPPQGASFAHRYTHNAHG